MKRFWLVLLSLGLIMAFSVSAFAVDVKVSGEYYAAGLSLNKTSLANCDTDYGFGKDWTGKYAGYMEQKAGVGTAFFYQRLRVGTDFIVSPCLKLVTRFDAMERIWGGDRSIKTTDGTGIIGATGTYNLNNSLFGLESQNLAFEIVYIDYTSPIGLFQIGYMPDYIWGTIWANRETGPTAGQIKFFAPAGPVTVVAAYAKEEDHSYSAYYPVSDLISDSTMAMKSDRDYDSYRLGFIYNFKSDKAAGEAGALFIFNRDASNRGNDMPGPPYMNKAYVLQPYFKAKIGPAKLQGEINYMFGDAVDFENKPVPFTDQKLDSLSLFLDGDATFGLVSVGGSFAYVQGDDNASDSVKHDALTGGRDWDPCLIMFNNTTANSWIGPIAGWNNSVIDGEMKNAWFGQGRVGVTPMPQLSTMMSISYAQADKKGSFAGGTYGWEVDVTGTYKITNNLSYMLGLGYLFTGDYFKGKDGANEINDNYMLINKLTLSF